MTRFSNFTDDELDMMEEAFCNERLIYLVDEVRRERRYRESRKTENWIHDPIISDKSTTGYFLSPRCYYSEIGGEC